jgi:hypothetical protein
MGFLKAMSGFGGTGEAPTNDTLPLLEVRPILHDVTPNAVPVGA